MTLQDDRRITLDPDRSVTLPMLIIANPKSGKQQALQICNKMLVPRLEEAEIPYELMITDRRHHAKDFIAACPDLHKRYKAVVIVSGDGLLHEVVQGLFQDQQHLKNQAVPLGIVPGGSGNGLARSLVHFAKESYEDGGMAASIEKVISGSIKPMDLTRVTSFTGQTYYSFLSIGWGFFADCDIGSECLRFMVKTSLKNNCEITQKSIAFNRLFSETSEFRANFVLKLRIFVKVIYFFSHRVNSDFICTQ